MSYNQAVANRGPVELVLVKPQSAGVLKRFQPEKKAHEQLAKSKLRPSKRFVPNKAIAPAPDFAVASRPKPFEIQHHNYSSPFVSAENNAAASQRGPPALA